MALYIFLLRIAQSLAYAYLVISYIVIPCCIASYFPHKVHALEIEKKELLDQKRQIEHDLTLPTITEVSFEQVNAVLNEFSKIIPTIEPEKQKDLLHTIINKITINAGNSPDQRSVEDIELFFDASLREEFVLTYGTVHRGLS